MFVCALKKFIKRRKVFFSAEEFSSAPKSLLALDVRGRVLVLGIVSVGMSYPWALDAGVVLALDVVLDERLDTGAIDTGAGCAGAHGHDGVECWRSMSVGVSCRVVLALDVLPVGVSWWMSGPGGDRVSALELALNMFRR